MTESVEKKIIWVLLVYLLISSLLLFLIKNQAENILLSSVIIGGGLLSMVFISIISKKPMTPLIQRWLASLFKFKKEEKSLYEILDLYFIFSFILALVATILINFLTKNILFSIFSFFVCLFVILFLLTYKNSQEIIYVRCSCGCNFFEKQQQEKIRCPNCGQTIS